MNEINDDNENNNTSHKGVLGGCLFTCLSQRSF